VSFSLINISSSLNKKKISIKPHYSILSKRPVGDGQFEVQLKDLPNTTESLKLYHVKNIVRDIKETVCRFSDVSFDEQQHANIPGIVYELPDGNSIELGTDRFKVPELMFNPSPLNDAQFMGIHDLVCNAVAKCDTDIRREMHSNLIVTGGNSLLSMFSERFHKELSERSPQMYKFKMLATNSSIERKFSVWIGGSILGSLGTFHQLWISKQEYEEHGSIMVERKCP